MTAEEKLIKIAASYGVSPETYDQWVAGHEAAHAIVTLHVGAELTCIALNALDMGLLSRARTIQTAGKANIQRLIVIGAAGPAYDESVRASLRLPEELMSSVLKNDRDSVKALIKMLKPGVSFSDAQFDEHFWNAAKVEADGLIKNPGLAAKIERVSATILDAMKAGKTTISAAEVDKLLSARGAEI